MDATILDRILRPIKRRIQLMLVRAIVEGVDDGKGIQQIQLTALADETLDNIPRIQNYGFTSKPKPGSEAFVGFVNGARDQGVVIAVDDRRYRIKAMEDGEVAIYTDEGDKIHFKRGNKIVVQTGELEANATVKVKITSPNVEINANTKVQVTSPQVEIIAASQVTMTTPFVVVSGLIQCAGIAAGVGAVPVSGKAVVQGSIEATGNIKSQSNVEDSNGTMAEMRGYYNTHKHIENNGSGGNPFTNTTDTPMT